MTEERCESGLIERSLRVLRILPGTAAEGYLAVGSNPTLSANRPARSFIGPKKKTSRH